MRPNLTGYRVGTVAAVTAGTILLTGAGAAAVPDSAGQGVKFCFSKKAADTMDGGALLSYLTPGATRKQCAKGHKLLAVNLG